MARATTSFATSVDDEEIIVHAGEELPDDHPAVKALPELFGAPAKKAPAKRAAKAKK